MLAALCRSTNTSSGSGRARPAATFFLQKRPEGLFAQRTGADGATQRAARVAPILLTAFSTCQRHIQVKMPRVVSTTPPAPNTTHRDLAIIAVADGGPTLRRVVGENPAIEQDHHNDP